MAGSDKDNLIEQGSSRGGSHKNYGSMKGKYDIGNIFGRELAIRQFMEGEVVSNFEGMWPPSCKKYILYNASDYDTHHLVASYKLPTSINKDGASFRIKPPGGEVFLDIQIHFPDVDYGFANPEGEEGGIISYKKNTFEVMDNSRNKIFTMKVPCNCRKYYCCGPRKDKIVYRVKRHSSKKVVADITSYLTGTDDIHPPRVTISTQEEHLTRREQFLLLSLMFCLNAKLGYLDTNTDGLLPTTTEKYPMSL